MNKYNYENGISFGCQGCGNCCLCEGYVFLNSNDIKNLLEVAKISAQDLRLKYLTSFRGYTVLRDRIDGACIFYDSINKGCKVYDARPIQCRTYPFWNVLLNDENKFNAEKDTCPGIDSGKFFSKKEIDVLRNKF